MSTPEDEFRTSILWPYMFQRREVRRAWRVAVYDAGFALTSDVATSDGRRGALSVPTWVNRVLAAVAHAMHWAGSMMVVEEAARVLRDPDLCLAVRAAWTLGGVEAAAGVVRRESYPVAQGDAHGS